jgi:hypothetical protein
MITRREAALRLDISVEMAKRHGIAAKISEEELAELDGTPPSWLAQSRANRTGKKAVWVQLTCDVCGYEESTRPKKWWPPFTYLTCDHHSIGDIPLPAAGHKRSELDGIGTRFIAIIDEPPVA